jgi:acetyl esterase/lipase
VMTRAAEPPDAVLRYAGHSDAVVDVFLPVSLGRPEHPATLLLFVHGGFWREEYDRTHVRPLADALRRRGFVVAVPEYRRVGGAGGWPQTADDVDAALAVVPGMLGDVAPGYVEPATLPVVAGHSAGGHLALLAGLRAGHRRVAAIVALAPVTDLLYAARVRMGDGAVQDLLGGEPPDLPDRYADADVTRMLTPAEVPVTIIQGDADLQVPAEMNRLVAARHGGSSVRYVELAGVDHFAVIDPLSPVFESTLLPTLERAARACG